MGRGRGRFLCEWRRPKVEGKEEKDNAETLRTQRFAEKQFGAAVCVAPILRRGPAPAGCQRYGGMLEFAGYEDTGDLCAGAVLSDEVHLLQLPYWSGVCGAVCTLCSLRLR